MWFGYQLSDGGIYKAPFSLKSRIPVLSYQNGLPVFVPPPPVPQTSSPWMGWAVLGVGLLIPLLGVASLYSAYWTAKSRRSRPGSRRWSLGCSLLPSRIGPGFFSPSNPP